MTTLQRLDAELRTLVAFFELSARGAPSVHSKRPEYSAKPNDAAVSGILERIRALLFSVPHDTSSNAASASCALGARCLETTAFLLSHAGATPLHVAAATRVCCYLVSSVLCPVRINQCFGVDGDAEIERWLHLGRSISNATTLTIGLSPSLCTQDTIESAYNLLKSFHYVLQLLSSSVASGTPDEYIILLPPKDGKSTPDQMLSLLALAYFQLRLRLLHQASTDDRALPVSCKPRYYAEAICVFKSFDQPGSMADWICRCYGQEKAGALPMAKIAKTENTKTQCETICRLLARVSCLHSGLLLRATFLPEACAPAKVQSITKLNTKMFLHDCVTITTASTAIPESDLQDFFSDFNTAGFSFSAFYDAASVDYACRLLSGTATKLSHFAKNLQGDKAFERYKRILKQFQHQIFKAVKEKYLNLKGALPGHVIHVLCDTSKALATLWWQGNLGNLNSAGSNNQATIVLTEAAELTLAGTRNSMETANGAIRIAGTAHELASDGFLPTKTVSTNAKETLAKLRVEMLECSVATLQKIILKCDQSCYSMQTVVETIAKLQEQCASACAGVSKFAESARHSALAIASLLSPKLESLNLNTAYRIVERHARRTQHTRADFVSPILSQHLNSIKSRLALIWLFEWSILYKAFVLRISPLKRNAISQAQEHPLFSFLRSWSETGSILPNLFIICLKCSDFEFQLRSVSPISGTAECALKLAAESLYEVNEKEFTEFMADHPNANPWVTDFVDTLLALSKLVQYSTAHHKMSLEHCEDKNECCSRDPCSDFFLGHIDNITKTQSNANIAFNKETRALFREILALVFEQFLYSAARRMEYSTVLVLSHQWQKVQLDAQRVLDAQFTRVLVHLDLLQDKSALSEVAKMTKVCPQSKILAEATECLVHCAFGDTINANTSLALVLNLASEETEPMPIHVQTLMAHLQGQVFYLQGHGGKALHYTLKALPLARHCNNILLFVHVLSSIIQMQVDMGLSEDAKKFALQGLQLAEYLDSKTMRVRFNLALAAIYSARGEFDEAKKYVSNDNLKYICNGSQKLFYQANAKYIDAQINFYKGNLKATKENLNDAMQVLATLVTQTASVRVRLAEFNIAQYYTLIFCKGPAFQEYVFKNFEECQPLLSRQQAVHFELTLLQLQKYAEQNELVADGSGVAVLLFDFTELFDTPGTATLSAFNELVGNCIATGMDFLERFTHLASTFDLEKIAHGVFYALTLQKTFCSSLKSKIDARLLIDACGMGAFYNRNLIPLQATTTKRTKEEGAETKILDALSMSECATRLPSNWGVCSLSIDPEGKNLVVCAFSSLRNSVFEDYVVVLLPLPQDTEHGFKSMKLEHDNIMRENEETLRKEIQTREDKLEWWASRTKLDFRIYELLANIETKWLGAFRGLLRAGSLSSCPMIDIITEFLKALSEFIALTFDFSAPPNMHDFKNIVPRPIVHSWLVSAGSFFGNSDSNSSALCGLTSDAASQIATFILKQCAKKHAAYEPKEQDLPKLAYFLASYFKIKCEEVRKRLSEASLEEHTVIILDGRLSMIPWESTTVLNSCSVTRAFSIASLTEQLGKHPESRVALDPNSVYYVLNPSTDLKNTQQVFEPMFPKKWAKCIGKIPPPEDFLKNVCQNQVYLYLGHGSGEQIAGGPCKLVTEILSHKQVPRAALIIGCSSGKLQAYGRFNPSGTQVYMMHAYTTTLVNLWDVTDKDIDKFTHQTLKSWGLLDSTNSALSLPQAVAKSRRACRFRYLNGAAPVVYGLPAFLHSQ